MQPLFRGPWIAALAAELAASESYRRAAARWEGDLLLEVSDGGGDEAVYLDLHHGECRCARAGTAADREAVRFWLAAPRAVWEELLAGRLAPATAVLSRKLELQRGRLTALLPHIGAAQELVQAAARASTHDGHGSGAQRTPLDRGPGAAGPTASSVRRYRSLAAGGLDWAGLPLRLWEKAKREGIWNPADLDFAADRADWLRLSEPERLLLLHLAALFGGGEESVVLDLLPLLGVIAAEGRLEEELFLTAFLWEEAKHVETFRRFFDAVAGEPGDLERFHSPSYRRLFAEELPQAMGRLRDDPSPTAQAVASTTYNLVVEGVLAETGYHAYHEVLVARAILPAMQRAIAYLKADESRHLAYGVHLLSRLVAAHGEPVMTAIRRQMEALLPVVTGLIEEALAPYGPEPPFGLRADALLDFAARQFEKRLRRVERGEEP